MQRSRFAVVIGAVFVLWWSGLPAGSAQTDRPTVALLDFEFGSVQPWWSGAWDIGGGIADLVVDELVNDGSFRVIERTRLDAVLAEQNFSNSARAEPNASEVAAMGKALGVRYLIVGSVTTFGTEARSTRLRGGAFGGGRIGLGDVGTSQGRAQVALTARVIDTATGEIMVSARGEGQSRRSGLLLGGTAAGRAGALGGIEMNSSDFRETILGEATEAAVKELATRLVAARTRLSSQN